jgi:hypothetical protein
MDKALEVWSRYDTANDEEAYSQVVAELQAGGFGNPEADRIAKVIAGWITDHVEGRWDSYAHLTLKEGFLELAAKASS